MKMKMESNFECKIVHQKNCIHCRVSQYSLFESDPTLMQVSTDDLRRCVKKLVKKKKILFPCEACLSTVFAIWGMIMTHIHFFFL